MFSRLWSELQQLLVKNLSADHNDVLEYHFQIDEEINKPSPPLAQKKGWVLGNQCIILFT